MRKNDSCKGDCAWHRCILFWLRSIKTIETVDHKISVFLFLKLRSFQWQKWKHYISSQTVPSQTIQPKNWLLHIELNVIDSKFSHILNFPHNLKFSILLHFDFFYKYNWLLATLDLTQWCVNSLQTTCFSSPISHTEGKVQIGNNQLGSPLWNILFSCSM